MSTTNLSLLLYSALSTQYSELIFRIRSFRGRRRSILPATRDTCAQASQPKVPSEKTGSPKPARPWPSRAREFAPDLHDKARRQTSSAAQATQKGEQQQRSAAPRSQRYKEAWFDMTP